MDTKDERLVTERMLSACRAGELETVKRLSSYVKRSLSYRPLHNAVWYGNLNVVRYLVSEAHYDPNVEDKDGWTSLHYACGYGHLNIVRYLVNEAHCDPNARNNYRWTPLHYACRDGHDIVVRYLVKEAHCNPHVKNHHQLIPLHYASRNGHHDVVRYLVNEAHCDPNVKDSYGWTPVHYACREGHLDVVRYLVNEAHCDPNIKNNDGRTPLHYPCEKENLSIVRCLVNEAHCDPNVKNNDGWTPLHYACLKGYLNIVMYLVHEAHCDPSVEDKYRWTPLHYACRYGYLDIIRCLATKTQDPFDPNVKDNDGMTPLHYVCTNRHLNVVRYLVAEANCDPNITENYGATPLHYACRDGHLNVVGYLVIEAQCDPNIKNKDGWTPLFYAARYGYLGIVKCLVNQSQDHSDPNVKDNDGKTPLHCACRNGHLDVVRYLVNEAHSAPNVTDKGGETPLHNACMSGHLDVVRYLVNEAHCDTTVKTKSGWTLVHFAITCGDLGVIRYLVNQARCDPNVKTNDGETPLHFACKWRREIVVEYLLKQCDCDPNCTAKDGSTPLAAAQDTKVIRLLLQHGAVAIDLYKYYGEVLPGGIPAHLKPAQSTVALFVVGDKGAGKSTLTKALITEKDGRISTWVAKHIKCGGVKEKTAGIECHTIHSSRIGSFIIYDLAGHREFHNSHDTVIRSIASGKSPMMFLFVVDLTDTVENIKRTASYWLSFIQSQVHVRTEASLQVSMPCLLAVGSHVDSPLSTLLEEKESIVRHFFKNAKNIKFINYVAVDCRYSESRSLTQLRPHLRDTHDKLQIASEITFQSHCFHVFLVSQCGSKPGIQLSNLMKMIASNTLSKDYFLPQKLEDLHETCEKVNRMGIMLYVQTKSMDSNWVIIDKDVLLREVNGSVFAPKKFPDYKELTRTGVVPFSNICSTFDKLIKTKAIEPELIVDYLVHMEFCRELTEEDGLKLVTETHPKYKEERHFLFPALTPPNPPPDIWQPNPQISYSEYSSCWLLECHDYKDYLTSRFREVLLLRLAFTHAFPMKPDEVNPASPALHQRCTIWKYGIKWTTGTFVDALVEVDDKRTGLLLHCKEGKELSLVKVRSQVISKILSVKDEICGDEVDVVEKMASNPTYPIESGIESPILITDIAHAISHHDDGVHLTAHTLSDISELLLFEPYKFCTPEYLVDIYSNTPRRVTSYFLECITRNIKRDGFCTKLNISEEAVYMLQEWSQGTYQRLRQQMDHYSVFSGRDILDIAAKHSSSTPPPISLEYEGTLDTEDDSILVLYEPPTLPQLLELEIPLRVRDKYNTFGVLLLNDKAGDNMAVIKDRCRGDPEKITHDILRDWIRGRGITVLWESLVATLRKCQLPLLADQIEMARS